MSEDEDLARAIALSLQDYTQPPPYTSAPPPYTSAPPTVNDHEGDGDGGNEDDESDDEGGYNSYDEYVRYVEHVKHLESGESDEDEDDEDEDEDKDEDEEVADEYESDEDPYEEVVDFDGSDIYAKYIENLRRRQEEEEEDARFRADLASAIAASKAMAPSTTSAARLTSVSASNQAIFPAAAGPSTAATQPRSTVLNALERTAFLAHRPVHDRERLERLKRRRGDPEDLHGAERPHPKRPTPCKTTNCALASQDNPRLKEEPLIPGEAEVFWDGELRQNANIHVEPRLNGEDGKPIFRLTDIIGDKSQIEFAILSTYALQLSWIKTFFTPSTPVVLVTQPEPEDNGKATMKQVLPNWIRVTPFLPGGRGAMHMKFLLLFYKSGRLRIIISTANLMAHDWRDVENTVWVQDVPRRPSPIPHVPEADDFPSVLERVLCAINVAPAITNLVLTDHPNIPLTELRAGALRTRWDFLRVRPRLVPSLAGNHEGWPAVLKSGHMALKHAVHRLNPQQRAVSLEYQGSSIVAYSAGWLAEFVLSARGVSPEAVLNATKSRRAPTAMPAPSTLKILFPTWDWVRGSVLGEAGAGTMFCRKSTWEATEFPRHLLCESQSRRGRVLMHSKMMIAVFVGAGSSGDRVSKSEADSDIVEVKVDRDDVVGYAYVGSHNFTPSAWGTLSGSGCAPVLNVTNYELGIVFPLKDEAEIDRVVCYERPAKRYRSRDLPWMQDVPNNQRDQNTCLAQRSIHVAINIRS